MDFKDSNILITGGAGFIGSNLAIRLADTGAPADRPSATCNTVGYCARATHRVRPYNGKFDFFRVP